MDRHTPPSIARQLAGGLLQLLRAQTRYARGALVRPPFFFFNGSDREQPGRVLSGILGLLQGAAAAAVTGSCKGAAAGKYGSCSMRGGRCVVCVRACVRACVHCFLITR